MQNDFDVDDLEVPQISQANYYSEDRKRFGPGSAKVSSSSPVASNRCDVFNVFLKSKCR